MGNCFSKSPGRFLPPHNNDPAVRNSPGISSCPTSCSEPFVQILLDTNSGGELQVLFDDNRFDNRWSYHSGGNNVHVTELFQVCPVGGNKVEIFAVGPPLSLTPTFRWQLIVNEQGGAPDLYPVFRAIIPGSLVNDSTTHAQFEREDSGLFTAFSFVSFSDTNPKRYYLVPGPEHIQIEETNDQKFVFGIEDISTISGNFRSRKFIHFTSSKMEIEYNIVGK